jgi:hypothetical protein
MSNASTAPVKAGFAPQIFGFTSAALDDFGLDVYAFRAYHAIARRAGADGVCWEAVAKIADRCQMSERRLHQALRELERRGLVSRTRREQHETSIYALTTPAPGADPPLHQVQTPPAPGADKGIPLKVSQNEEEPSSAAPTAPTQSDAQKLVDLWNTHCGQLAKTRVVSREVEAKLRALRKRHGDALDQLFVDGIEVVRTDPFWLGKNAPTNHRRNRREGAPYGLVNYLRHIEDKANVIAAERAESVEAAFPEAFAVGQSWWTRTLGAVVVVGVATDRKLAKVRVVRAKDGGPAVGLSTLIGPSELKTQRHVEVTL